MSNERSRILSIAVVGLLILNFCTLAFMWFDHPRDHHGQPVSEFIISELNLNNDQVAKFNQLKNEHHEKIMSIQDDLRQLHDKYFELIKTNSIDSAAVNSIATEMSAKQKEIELVTFYHFSEVRKISDENQKKKFDVIIDDALRMMAPVPPGGRHP